MLADNDDGFNTAQINTHIVRPEPATIALLGLSSVALIKRRRL